MRRNFARYTLALVVFITLSIFISSSHGNYVRTWRQTNGARDPKEIMVDVVNRLGLIVLKVHNYNNDNNIALSPYGATSVLTALLEGVKGPAALEIQRCGGFPHDKDIIRVGLRDIHRHLRSYFIPQEGFLSGLSLSSEKVTLMPEYQNILRFYGFDMTSFNTPIYPSDLQTTTLQYNTTTLAVTTDITTTTEMSTKVSMADEFYKEISSTKEEETTTETTTTTPQTTTMPPTTTKPPETTTEPPESRTVSTTILEETTTKIYKETKPDPTTTSKRTSSRPTTTATIKTTSPTEERTTVTPKRSTQDIKVAREVTTATMPPITNPPATTVPTTTPPTTVPTTVPTTMPPSTTPPKTKAPETTTVMTTTENGGTTVSPEKTTTEVTTTVTETVTTTVKPPKKKTKRSLVDYYIARQYDDAQDIAAFHLPYFPQRPKVLDPTYSFLVNEKFEETGVNFMTYEVVLPFHYIHNLNALALRFPLDSPKYYLLLILPVDTYGMNKLICDLDATISLKEIVLQMRPTFVRAVIPSFMLRGFVILTSTLQKIGIRSIFEPRRADFTPMTDDKNIYVTNIEQAITVTIKNYMDTIKTTRSARYKYGPVDFRATHPFLYFVMDSELDVALVAGKIVNPLNSRIQ